MIRDLKMDEIVKGIASDSLVRVAFVLSTHGVVEICHPQENEKQVNQWALVLIPYLRLFSHLKDFRFSRIQYREGDLWIGRIYGDQYLVLLVMPSVDLTVFYQNIIFTIQNIQESTLNLEETNLEEPIESLLYQASNHIKNHSRSEGGFFGAFRKTAFMYFGALGEEWVDQSLENLWITLPIQQQKLMEEMIEETTKRMAHPLKRMAFKKDSTELIKKFLE